MEINDFGHAVFPQSKKGWNTIIDCWGKIKSFDKKYVWFEDNDGFPYLIERRDFQFERAEFKDKSK